MQSQNRKSKVKNRTLEAELGKKLKGTLLQFVIFCNSLVLYNKLSVGGFPQKVAALFFRK